jgi:hypothetical protein
MMTGGCLCGAVRYRAATRPSRAVVCSGEMKTYETRSDESGRWIRLHFCPRCGTTLYSTWQEDRGEIALLAGTLDDTSGVKVDRHVWTRSKQHWLELPPGAQAFEKSSRA